MTNAARYLTRPAGAALAGLVRRFIDPHAEIAYVPADQVLAVAARDGAHSFDAPGAEFTHRYDQCTFEVVIDAFNLALVRLARIVHAADIADDLASDPLGPGLLAIGEGSLDAVQLRAATLLRLSEHLQAPERGSRLMITVDGLTPLPTTELDDYLVVCKEFPDAGAALGRHLAWELGSDDATAVLSRAEAWIGSGCATNRLLGGCVTLPRRWR